MAIMKRIEASFPRLRRLFRSGLCPDGSLWSLKAEALLRSKVAFKGHHSAITHKIGTQPRGPLLDCLFSKMNFMKDSSISRVSFNYVSLEEKVRVIVVSVPVLTEFLADSDSFGKCLAILLLSFHCGVIFKRLV